MQITATQTIGDALRALAQTFRKAGKPTPELDARLLLGEVTGLRGASLYGHGDLAMTSCASTRLALLRRRRLAGEPVSRILGRREFWGLNLEIGPGVLDPRPDSETLVSAACTLLRDTGQTSEPLAIADLGTGSGALLIALLSEFENANGVAVDISAAALRIAKRNMLAHDLQHRASLIQCSWLDAVVGQFDLIVCNPPYIRTRDIGVLEPEVALHDPQLALDGGDDGLAAFRALAPRLRHALKSNGLAILEVGVAQHAIVECLLSEYELVPVAPRSSIWRDLNGTIRCLAVSYVGSPGKKGVGMDPRSR